MINAVIMAGGAGTRFWPWSRHARPKQFLNLAGDRPLLVQTVERIAPLVAPERILVVTHADQAAATAALLPDLPPANIIGEPARRDTAACIGLAAALVRKRHGDETMVVMPADHVTEPAARYRETIAAAAERLERDPTALITIGIPPAGPSELYGYIHRGEPAGRAGELPAFRVIDFKEKPDRYTAEAYLADGGFYWNSGVFVWRSGAILAALDAHAPEHGALLGELAPVLDTPGAGAALAAAYPRFPRISIDYAVMEKADNILVLEADYRWDDVGDWNALARHRGDGRQVALGPHLDEGSRDLIVAGDGDHLIATVGLENLVIVHTPRATLVCARDQTAGIKRIVARLESLGRGDLL